MLTKILSHHASFKIHDLEEDAADDRLMKFTKTTPKRLNVYSQR